MNVDVKVILDAYVLLNSNTASIARAEEKLLSVGCSWCTNCSGIVGG